MKKRENILITRTGAKDNDIKSFMQFLPLDCKIVVEPFGGSFAVCRRVYHDDKYKKFVNDTDPGLAYAYTHPEEYIKLLSDTTELYKSEPDKKLQTLIPKIIKFHTNQDLINYMLHTKFIRGNLFKIVKNNDYTKQTEFIKKITFSSVDYLNCIEKYREDETAFIFLDPPYLFSDNSGYFTQIEENDMTDIIFKIFDIINDKTTKCKIMLIINKLKILERIFKDFVKGEYTKQYQVSKKIMKHLIICNYDI